MLKFINLVLLANVLVPVPNHSKLSADIEDRRFEGTAHKYVFGQLCAANVEFHEYILKQEMN